MTFSELWFLKVINVAQSCLDRLTGLITRDVIISKSKLAKLQNIRICSCWIFYSLSKTFTAVVLTQIEIRLFSPSTNLKVRAA